MDYSIIRSKRRTVAIHIYADRVEVRAPFKTSKRDIEDFVYSKEKWIKDKLAITKEQTELRKAFSLDYGDSVILRGKEYIISARTGNRAGFDGEVFYLPPDLNADQIKGTCIQIYRRLAKVYITKRVLLYAEKIGVHPNAIKVNSAKTRWGSCSSKRNINFTWRLVMADDSVIDYVVVHELAHLIEMNHSMKFWAIVENILPDYRERKELLCVLQKKLARESWAE